VVHPRGLKLGAVCEQGTEASRGDVLYNEAKELQRGGVAPVEVFDD
jgi:hypothetical protein